MRRNKHANYQSQIMNASIPIHSGQAGQGGYKQLISHLLVSWSAKRVWEPVMTLLSPLLHFCLMSDHWRPGAMSGHSNTNICGAGAN